MMRRRPALLFGSALLFFGSLAQADTPPVAIDGVVKQTEQVTADDLRRLPAVERQVSFETDHGTQTATYTGVLLWTLIAQAGVNDSAKWGELRHVVAVTAKDKYVVMLSIGEIDPNFGNTPAMLAYAANGKPLDALRLVVPGDRHGARDVRNVVRIEVK